MGTPKGAPSAFSVDQRVRYKPGQGTYGYEHLVEDDGRIPAVVVGHSATRVRIRFLQWDRVRCVDAASLEVVS